ncbi:MAG: hypothetical protein ACYS0D_12945, partial [Planctomycetota bacterium]
LREANAMLSSFTILSAIVVALSPPAGDIEVESFSTGDFTNPFFQHVLEFDDPCCWEITNCEVAAGDPNCDLHLRPNFDLITFKLPSDRRVHTVSVSIRDFEGGFVGDQPTSVFVARASSNDFIFRNAAEIAQLEVLTISINDIGQLFGEPLGDIVSLQLQAANEGNSVEPGVGAFYDDLTAVLIPSADLDGDGIVSTADLLMLLAAWGPCDDPCPPACTGDLDGDCLVSTQDLLNLLSQWG